MRMVHLAKRQQSIANFGFPLKKAKYGNQFLNSSQNLIFQLAELGDVKALNSLQKKIKHPKKIKAKELVELNKFLNRTRINKFVRTSMQQRKISGEQIKKVSEMIEYVKKQIKEARAEHNNYAIAISKKFGVPEKAVKNLNIPPFYQVLRRKSFYKLKPEQEQLLLPDRSKIDFFLSRYIEDKIVPTQPGMKKRLYNEKTKKTGSVGVAFNGMTMVRTIKGQTVLVVDVIQTFPRTKDIGGKQFVKRNFPEYIDYQKLLLVDAFRTAEELGIKKVFLTGAKEIPFEHGTITRNIKREREKLGKDMKGTPNSIIVEVEGEKIKIKGYEWSK